jgi:hypothetical protein
MSHLSLFGGVAQTTLKPKNNLIVESSEDISREIINDLVNLVLDNILENT